MEYALILAQQRTLETARDYLRWSNTEKRLDELIVYFSTDLKILRVLVDAGSVEISWQAEKYTIVYFCADGDPPHRTMSCKKSYHVMHVVGHERGFTMRFYTRTRDRDSLRIDVESNIGTVFYCVKLPGAFFGSNAWKHTVGILSPKSYKELKASAETAEQWWKHWST